LTKEPGVNVEAVNGDRGELSVSVDGKVVAQKGTNMPSTDEVLAAVRKAA
jgi:hypothetical protein